MKTPNATSRAKKISSEKPEPDTSSAPTTKPAKTRKRQPAEIKARIMREALDEFATHGYEGASVRTVAKNAHVSISLLIYHFGSKDELWKAVMADVFAHVGMVFTNDDANVATSATDRLRHIIEKAVRFFAEYPAVHRLMTLEGHQISERLIYICDNYLKQQFNEMCNLISDAQKEGSVIDADPARLRLAITSIAAVPFSVSAEYQYLTNRNPFTEREIARTIDLINQLIFVG